MKKRVVPLTLAALLSLSLTVPALAALGTKTIQVSTGVDIYVDGVEMKPTDVNGNLVETFLYNGTTYVPLRAVSQSLGYNVNWDGENQRVYIGEQPGEKQYLLDVCPPYQTNGLSYPTTITMAGKKYANCIQGGFYSDAYFNLNGGYTKLSFDLGHVDGKDMGYTPSLNIYLDGKLAFSVDLTGDMMPEHYEVPLYGALQMVIEFQGNGGSCYSLANVEIR